MKEIFKSKSMMMKHEKGESKSVEKREKKMGEKDAVRRGRPKATGMYLLNKAANYGKTKK